MELIAYLIFALSGAAGLMYESVWARYLGLFVGHSAYAQVIVLAIFLGGMALGAIVVGSRTERIRDPLRAYALVEIVVGLMGLVFHEVFGVTTGWAYDVLFPRLGAGFATDLVRWVLAGAMLLPQSVLLGSTFPLLAACLLRRSGASSGRVLAQLYFANGLGAALGVLLAGFWLVGFAGLPGTVAAAGILNLTVGLAALLLAMRARQAARPAASTAAVPDSERKSPVTPARLVRMLIAVSFGTAVASFVYEIAWLRMLALVLGSATHAFELMLSAFILGLAVGALWARRRVDRWADPLRALGLVQWLMGLAALATLPTYAAAFGWSAWLFDTLSKTDGGYSAFNVMHYGVSLAIMLPSTFFAGITFPLITRTLYVGTVGERAVGTVYGANTLGSIAGVVLAGLVLLPLIGLRYLLVAGAVLDMAIGVTLLLVLMRGGRRLAGALAGGAVAAVVWALTAGQVSDARLASGVYRHGDVDVLAGAEIYSHRDGRTATVSVYQDGPLVTIATNGKPDGSLPSTWIVPDRCSMASDTASLRADQATQIVAPLVTLVHRPPGARVAVVGHGTGMSAHAVLADASVERVVTVEIEPAMVDGSRAFYPANRRVFDDPRSQIVTRDARSHFATTPERFDVIFSEPSNPWVSGVASLFTIEFYAFVRDRLDEDGVFGQWLHLYELSDGLVLTVLAAIHRTFDDYALFATSPGDILVVAVRGGKLRPPDWSRMAEIFASEEGCGLRRPGVRELASLRIAERPLLAPLLAERVTPNSDYYPVLDLGAQRTFFTKEFARGIYGLATTRFDLSAALTGRRFEPLSGEQPFIAGHRRLVLLHTAGFLQAPAPLDPGGGGVPVPFRAARHAWLNWQARLSHPAPPEDWGAWLMEFRAVARDRLGGTAGWLDHELFDATMAYAARHDAPAPVDAVLGFHEALASWDFAGVTTAAEAILATGGDLADWIEPELLAEGAAVAYVRLGEGDRARAVLDDIMLRAPFDRTTLRYRLVSAVVGEETIDVKP